VAADRLQVKGVPPGREEIDMGEEMFGAVDRHPCVVGGDLELVATNVPDRSFVFIDHGDRRMVTVIVIRSPVRWVSKQFPDQG
jgi:hypothetical protein